MNVEWLVCYLFLALDCSRPLIDALAHAPLLIQRSNQKSIDLVVDHFITKIVARYGTLLSNSKYTFRHQHKQTVLVLLENLSIDRSVHVEIIWNKTTREVCFRRRVRDGRFTSDETFMLKCILWKNQIDTQVLICPQIYATKRLNDFI